MPRRSADSFTGDAASAPPRPLARSGWVITNGTSYPAATSFSRVGTANGGVPIKTTRAMATLDPIARLREFTHLAADQIPLQRTDVRDVELAVEVVGLMQEGTSEQILA